MLIETETYFCVTSWGDFILFSVCLIFRRTNTTLSGADTIQASDAVATIQSTPPPEPAEPIPDSGTVRYKNVQSY